MRNRDVVELVKLKYTENTLGSLVKEIDTKRKVYANRYKIGMNEFYAAGRNDLKADKAFQLHTFEYLDEEQFIHEGVTYSIFRVDEKGDKLVVYGQTVTADEH